MTNLNLSVGEVSAALQESFLSTYEGGRLFYLFETDFEQVQLEALIEKQSGDNWKYGATPRFIVENQRLRLEILKGTVVSAEGIQSSQFLYKPFLLRHFHNHTMLTSKKLKSKVIENFK